ETDPNLLNMVNQRDNDYKTAKNNIVFNELQQLTPQQIIDSGNLFDKFEYLDKLTPQQQAQIAAARGNAQQTLRTQALNELSPEEIADAASIGNIKLAPEYGSFNSQDAEEFRKLQDKYRGELDSKNYSLAMQLLNSIPNPLDRARLVNNPSEFKARLEQAGIKFRKGETFTQLISALGATYNDPTKKTELDRIHDDQITSQLADAAESGKSLSEIYSIIDNAVDSQGNHLTEQQKADKLNYILDNSNIITDLIYDQTDSKEKDGKTKKFPTMEKELNNINNAELTPIERASAADSLKAYGDKLFENFPLHMRKVLRKKYESTIDSMLKTSNETAKVQFEISKNTARNNAQKWANSKMPNDINFKSVIEGGYRSKIASNSKTKDKANDIKSDILNMLHSNTAFSEYADIYQYMRDNDNSAFANYLFDTMYPLYESNSHNYNNDSLIGKVKEKLNTLKGVFPYIKVLEQSNIQYSGK
ncbi:MAG: hypothetical protein II625_10900, partial [Bacilli bacterium]|nr:hypothetical protein [Bacilli bacterium]